MYKREDLYRILQIKDLICRGSLEQIAFSYYFSYSNICQVCFTHERETRLKRCTLCKMVYYCGKDHQMIHWPIHKEFCKVATELLAQQGGLNLFDKMNTDKEQDRIDWKNGLTDYFEKQLKRKLIPHEKSLIFFPKLCAVCYESDPSRLKFCPKCPQASFCKKHFEDESHVKDCQLFSQGLLSEAIGIVFRAAPIPGVAQSVPFNSENKRLPLNIQDFLDYYCKCKKKFLSFMKRPEIQMYMSEHLTRPLTLLYALQKLRHPVEKCMTIHVIGSNNFEEVGQTSWEVLLHWLPNLMSLKVVLIGPECITSTKQIAVCKTCNSRSKNLTVESHGLLYKDYWTSKSFTKAHIIIAFNASIKIGLSTWIESLPLLAKVNCPFILTTFFESAIDTNHEVMLQMFGHSARYTLREINPFASLRPYRDVVNTTVFYRNTGVLMYTKLGQRPIITNLSGMFLDSGSFYEHSSKEKLEGKVELLDPVVRVRDMVKPYQNKEDEETGENDYLLVIFYNVITVLLIIFAAWLLWCF